MKDFLDKERLKLIIDDDDEYSADEICDAFKNREMTVDELDKINGGAIMSVGGLNLMVCPICKQLARLSDDGSIICPTCSGNELKK